MAKKKARRTRGNIIVISAPSGAGKSTLIKRLMASVPGLSFSVSHTTRPPRPGERNGQDYFFVSPARFKKMIAAGDFVEWADVFGNLYGTSWKQVVAAQEAGKDVLLDIDVQGHRQVRQRLREAVSIFILPPSFRELARRLRRRHADSPQVIARRLKEAKKEIAHWPKYDYLVVNDSLPRASVALRTVISAARQRRTYRQEQVRKICKTFGG